MPLLYSYNKSIQEAATTEKEYKHRTENCTEDEKFNSKIKYSCSILEFDNRISYIF